MPSLSTISNLLWAFGLALQILLLVLLVKRSIAPQRPLFTGLIAFFCARSVLLFTTSSHLSPVASLRLSAVLSLLDTLLQIALAFTLSLSIAHSPGRSRFGILILFGSLLVLSSSLTAALVTVLPAHSAAPVDRGVTFTAILFLLLFAYASVRGLPRLDRTILSGLAVFSLAAIASQIGRCIAASHRDATAFSAWTWASVATYLLVLLFWILRCQHPKGRSTAHSLQPE